MKSFQEVVHSCDAAAMQKLLNEGFDVNVPLANGQLPLVYLCHKLEERFDRRISFEEVHLVEMLLNEGANPDIYFSERPNSISDPFIHFLIKLLPYKGRGYFYGAKVSEKTSKRLENIISRLLEKDSLLEVVNQYGDTPFLHALSRGQIKLAKKLLEKNVSVHAKNKNQCSALRIACQNNLNEFVPFLIEQGLDVKEELNGKTLLDVVDEKNPDLILFLLQQGVRSERNDFFECLQIAQNEKHEGLLNYLFEHNIAALRNKQVDNALFYHEYNVIERLLKAGVDPNELYQGETVAMRVLKRFSTFDDVDEASKIVALLNKYGARFNEDLNSRQPTIAHEIVEKNDFFRGFAILADQGVPLNGQNEKGQTALHIAIQKRHYRSAVQLIEQGCDSTIVDDNGDLALDLLLEYMIHFGADEEIVRFIQLALPYYPQKRIPKNGNLLLFITARAGFQNLVEELISRGVILP